MRGRAAALTAAAARSTSPRARAGEAGDDRPADFARRSCGPPSKSPSDAIGKARFDDVDAEPVELPRQPQFFDRGHAEAGRLLAVAERRVEHAYSGRIAHATGSVGGCVP